MGKAVFFVAEKSLLAEGLRGLQGSAEARGTVAGRARTAVANGNLAESPKANHGKRLKMEGRKWGGLQICQLARLRHRI